MNEFVFVASSRHNRLWNPIRPAVDPSEQMATPALFNSKYKLLSGGTGKRVVTQESHPGSWETSKDGPGSTGKLFASPHKSSVKVESAHTSRTGAHLWFQYQEATRIIFTPPWMGF